MSVKQAKVSKIGRFQNPKLSPKDINRCRKMIDEVEKDFGVPTITDYRSNPKSMAGLKRDANKLVNKIKTFQYGLPEDQLGEYDKLLILYFPHIFENDNGYIKLVSRGRKNPVYYFNVIRSDANGKKITIQTHKTQLAAQRHVNKLRRNNTQAKVYFSVQPSWTIEKQKNSTASDFRQHQKITLENLSRMFQGKLQNSNHRVIGSDWMPKNTARLGHLVQLTVKNGTSTFEINFPESGESFLSADGRKNLWIAGKDARITKGVRNGLPSKGSMKRLGTLVQVDYVTAKNHIENGQTVRFYHELGEVTRENPQLFVDHDGFPMIVGGTYDVWDVGIVN